MTLLHVAHIKLKSTTASRRISFEVKSSLLLVSPTCTLLLSQGCTLVELQYTVQ